MVLTRIEAKLASGERLLREDVEILLAERDVLALGALAEEARRRRHGDRITFVRVADMPVEAPGVPDGSLGAAGEVRIVGVPRDLQAARAAVARIAAGSQGRPLSGFSLADLEALCAREGMPLLDTLRLLRDAGLEMIAEAPLDWLEDGHAALQAAARVGVPVARVTLQHANLDGFAALLHQLVAWQDELATLRAFAPLARQGRSPSATGYDDVRRVALARLLVDNIPSIQVDWTLCGPKLAQVALTFGADDLDAVSPVETPGLGPRRAPLEEVRRNIRAASLVPVERDGRFGLVSA